MTTNRNIDYVPIIYIDAFYVLGGYESSTIGRFDEATKTWSNAGNLISINRYGHNAIVHNEKMLVIGGHGTFATESCSLSEGHFSCEAREPTLKDYNWYPELFIMPENFCSSDP